MRALSRENDGGEVGDRRLERPWGSEVVDDGNGRHGPVVRLLERSADGVPSVSGLGVVYVGVPGKPNRRVESGLLVLFWALVSTALGVWLAMDGVYAPWDSAMHVEFAQRLRDGWLKPNPWAFYELSKFYPPAFHALAFPASLVSDHPDAYAFGSWVSLLGLMVGTWLLGRTLVNGAAGLAAGFLVCAYLEVIWLGRQVMTDLALGAAVALALWRLSVREPLADPRARRRLGGAFAFGMLTKWSFAFFLWLPTLAWLVRGLRESKPGWRRNAAVAAAWAIVPILPWYVRSVGDLISKAGWHLGEGVLRDEGDPRVLSLASLAYYPNALGEFYFTPPLALLLIAGAAFLAVALVRRSCSIRGWSAWSPSFLALLGGSAVVFAIANKDARYVLPLVSVFAVVSTSWIGALRGLAQGVAVGLVAVLSAGTILANLFVWTPPDLRDWKIEDAAARIAERLNDGEGGLPILVVPNTWWTSSATLRLAVANAHDGDEKILASPVQSPFDPQELSGFGTVVVVYPPPEEDAVSRGTRAAAEWVVRESGWQPYASFARGDGRALLLYAPPQP